MAISVPVCLISGNILQLAGTQEGMKFETNQEINSFAAAQEETMKDLHSCVEKGSQRPRDIEP